MGADLSEMFLNPCVKYSLGVKVYPKGEAKICPRCGHPYNYIKVRRRGSKVYYYAVHYYGYHYNKEGKVVKDVKECYLGPLVYDYVSRLHKREGLVLRGLTQKDRVLYYLDALITSLQNIELSKDMKLKLAKKFFEIAKVLYESHLQGK